MKVRESIKFKTTTVANLRPYDMFVLAIPRSVYMYIMTYNGPKYLELHDGAWRESGVLFGVTEEISIIHIEDLVYLKA
jgi:hypothetical protein